MSKPSRRRQPAPTAQPPAPGRPPTATRSSSPSGTARAGRRERARATYQPSFVERYRTLIVAVAALAGVILISAFVFVSAASPAYACTQEWVPTPTASPAAGAAPNPGYVQPDMGRTHVPVGQKVTYTFCPPASGSHYNAAGQGPIQPREYGPSDKALPEGWIHNLEHGAMVILYRGREGDPGITDAGQTALKALFSAFPASPVCGIQPGTSTGPVIARFDEMATPYAAIVWGRVLPLDDLDTTQILDFFQVWGERSNPEKQCAAPSAAPSGEASPSAAAPSAS